MKRIRISFMGLGGELDFRTVPMTGTEADIKAALLEMLEDAIVGVGDQISITEEGEQ